MDWMTILYYTVQSAIVIVTVIGCYIIIKA